VPDFKSSTCAPGWSKYAGARLSDLTINDLRDLHRQARAPSMRQAVEFELRRRTRRERRKPAPYKRRPPVFA
jgi:hypothetical protein